ncbi:MAG: HupE/UreJ family protein [Cyanobacteria bacterium J06638_28]
MRCSYVLWQQLARTTAAASSCLFPQRLAAIASLLLASGTLLFALPAVAHHPFGGETPVNALEGLMSGLGHPVIGPDHFVFVIAIGLVALTQKRGFVLPITFVLGTLAGTGWHLAAGDLPGAEMLISLSVVLLGVVLTTGQTWPFVGLMAISAIAGVLHGYAYGEAIVGAEMTPLVAYLLGFAVIQLIVALVAYGIGHKLLGEVATVDRSSLRCIGFSILGAGAAFLSGVILG